MLQFYTDPASECYTVAEEVQMAIEGGCRWINLCNHALSRDRLKFELEEIIPLCRESDAILVIDDDVELVNASRVHGIRITAAARLSPKEVRETLGPHAIIGVEVTRVDDIAALCGLDIDYVTADTSLLSEIVPLAREMQMPVVATGDVTVANKPQLLAAGASGLGASRAVVDAPDPSEYVRMLIST